MDDSTRADSRSTSSTDNNKGAPNRDNKGAPEASLVAGRLEVAVVMIITGAEAAIRIVGVLQEVAGVGYVG